MVCLQHMEKLVNWFTKKKYTNGELDGIFKLYFPCSNGEVSRYYEELKKKKSENDGIFKKLVSWVKGDLNPDQLPVTDNLRLDAIFFRWKT